MATIETFTYDDPIRGYRSGKRWIPAGTGKPCIIYAPGHGWNGRHPDEFFVADDFYLNQIVPKEGTDPVACFAIHSSSAAYDYTATFPNWLTSTSYTQDTDLRRGKSGGGFENTLYRCIDTHASTAATEPGVGADWKEFWYEVPAQELGDQLILGARHRTPAFRESGQLDMAAIHAHVVRNASVYGIDPGLIFDMGASAGGQQVGAFAYDVADAYASLERPVLGNDNVPSTAPKPAGVILRITPDDFKWYPFGSAMAHLWGRDLTAEWADIPDARKSALSPLGVLRSTGLSIPTFLAYGGWGYYNPATDAPPYASALYHEARNGYQMFQHLVGALVQADVTFVEDHPSLAATYNLWSTSGGTGAPERTIADTDESAEMWDWYAGLTGLTPNP